MSHLDIYSTSYGKKKDRESNCQFDSRPLKVKNRPDPGVCRWRVTYRWKSLKESYKIASDLIPIGCLSKKLWTRKVLGSPGTKSHSDLGAVEDVKNTIWGKVVASPKSGPWWVLWVQGFPWRVLALKVL